MKYGKAIRLLRSIKGMSQVELAEQCPFTPPMMSLIENDKRAPSLASIEAIAEVLGCPVFLIFLLAESDSKKLEWMPNAWIYELAKRYVL